MSVYKLNDSGTSSAEIDRLDMQHRTALKPMGDIPDEMLKHIESLDRPPAIADVGTGTGIWLRDLAPTLPPDSRLDGFDLDTTKFPARQSLPPNVTLIFGNCLEPFPEEYLGQYDIVHVRLLVYALRAEQWEQMAANLRTLLRPGGCLFSLELGYPGLSCLPVSEAWQRCAGLDMRYSVHLGRDTIAPLRFPMQMEAAGFSGCYQRAVNSLSKSEDVSGGCARFVLNGLTASMRGNVATGGFEWLRTKDDVDREMGPLWDDFESARCVMGLTLYWTVGRNP